MAAFLASSPLPAHAGAFKSPLRSFRTDAVEVVGSEEVYADAQSRLAQWRKDLVSSASFDAQQGLRELCHERENLKDLETDLAGVQGLVEAASQLQAGGARLAEVVHNSSEAAATRAEALARVSEDLRDICETRRLELQQEERKIKEQQAVADTQHEEALKLLGVYKERLGLDITRVAPQTVTMAFSLIDDCDSSREFSFTLGLGDSEGYCIRECAPHVPELKELLADLNANPSSSTALPRFVCSIRRAFLKLAGAAKAA